jgi:hypothetical protein
MRKRSLPMLVVSLCFLGATTALADIAPYPPHPRPRPQPSPQPEEQSQQQGQQQQSPGPGEQQEGERAPPSKTSGQ